MNTITNPGIVNSANLWGMLVMSIMVFVNICQIFNPIVLVCCGMLSLLFRFVFIFLVTAL